MTTNTETIDFQDSDVFGALTDAIRALLNRAAKPNYPQRNRHVDIQLAARFSSILHGWTYCKYQKKWVATREAIGLAGESRLTDASHVWGYGSDNLSESAKTRLLLGLQSVSMKGKR